MPIEGIELQRTTAKERGETDPVEVLSGPGRQTCHLQEGGIEVHARDEGLGAHAGLGVVGPVNQEWRAQAAFGNGGLAGAIGLVGGWVRPW